MRTPCISITNINCWMIFREIIVVYSSNHTKLINKINAKNSKLLDVKVGLHMLSLCFKELSNIHSIRLIIHFLILTVSLEWKRLMWWTKEGEVLWWSPAIASCWWRQPDPRGQWLDCTAHIDLRRTSPWLATDWWASLRNKTNVRVTLRQCDRTFLFCAPSLQRNTYFLKRQSYTTVFLNLSRIPYPSPQNYFIHFD
jgi:hypothetical protein